MKKVKTNLPGLKDAEIIESNPQMVKQFGCGPIIILIIIYAVCNFIN